jgi:hypothetical protein
LTDDNHCKLFGHPDRPAVCIGLTPNEEMCGETAEHALAWLWELELATHPDPTLLANRVRQDKHVAETTSLPAGLGMHVDLELVDTRGEAEAMALDIVPAAAADIKRGRIGANTPLAKAIRGKSAGAAVPYSLGDVTTVRIVRVVPSEVEISGEAAERRQEVLRRALTSAERTNAEMFAASFSGKWGDYSLDEADGWDQ